MSFTQQEIDTYVKNVYGEENNLSHVVKTSLEELKKRADSGEIAGYEYTFITSELNEIDSEGNRTFVDTDDVLACGVAEIVAYPNYFPDVTLIRDGDFPEESDFELKF